MIKIEMLTNENFVRDCSLSPGKLKKTYFLSPLMDQGRITLHVIKETLKSGAMPKDWHQLPNTQKKLESKNNMKTKLRQKRENINKMLL